MGSMAMMSAVMGRLVGISRVRFCGCSLPRGSAPNLLLPAFQLRCFSAVSGSSTYRVMLTRARQQPFMVDIRRSLSDEMRRQRTAVSYVVAAVIFMIGASYVSVPLYRMICQTTGLGGEIQKGHDTSKVETMSARKERLIRVRFNADTASSMQWNFRPQQSEIKLTPGETALAFYRAKNPTDKPIVGISTYNVVPFEAGQHFNKIQCFCFEEQRLNPYEEVDMPVFFYIDPEFCDDPKMEKVDVITLSYTFFEAKEGLQLSLPDYFKPHKY